MPAVPHKIRRDLVELRTENGSVYVRPSFWERIYLLWTFRNFVSLPKQVLNRHQQQLIDKLCRTAVVIRNGAIARTHIIGTVENMHLMPDRKTVAVTPTSKLVEMSTTSADFVVPRAVGSEGIVIGPSPAACNPIHVESSRRRGANVQYISAPDQGSAGQSETKKVSPAAIDSDRSRTRSRHRLKWALGVAGGGALIAILFYFREGRLALPIAGPQVALEAHQTALGDVRSEAVVHPEKVQQSVPGEGRQAATSIAISPRSPTVSFEQQGSIRGKTAILTPPPVASMDSTQGERLQVAEAPERGFGYPVAPIPTLTGSVSLKALIGADGTVKEVEVLSGNRTLAGAAVRAVRHWRYPAYALDGNAVEVETNITISFVGDDAVSISFPAAH